MLLKQYENVNMKNYPHHVPELAKFMQEKVQKGYFLNKSLGNVHKGRRMIIGHFGHT